MGYPMAGYLSNQHEISVYNRTKSKCYSWIKDYKGEVIDDLSSNNKKFDFIISSFAKNCGHFEFKDSYKCSLHKPLISSNLIN